MKVYLFDPASGLYEGEDFREADEVRDDDGITNRAPPQNWTGQVPVYDRNRSDWKLIPIDLFQCYGTTK
ncbi:MAG: hypothetical protein WCL71_11870 [Deltaproteobacteria bacterium]